MKQIKHIILLASLAGVLAVQAQTNAVIPDQTQTNPGDNAAQAAARAALIQAGSPAPVSTATDVVNTATAAAAPASAVPDNSANSEATASNSTVTVTTSSTVAVATNEVVTTTASTTNVTAAAPAEPATTVVTTSAETVPVAEAPVPAAPPVPVKPAGIPLIQFSDVPLTTAIENLARQAGINYMLDPKIAYGQPDASGQVKAEPTLSIRWENITAESALLALLDNYGLQMVRDPQTGIAKITVKDPSAPPPLVTRVVQLKYASVSNMVASVESTLTDKRSRVIADIRTSQLVVVATESEQEAVDILIRGWIRRRSRF